MFNVFKKRPLTTGLGIGLKPGSPHYRAYVGPPQDYDLISAMTFNLLTCAGLRQQHRVLDIGCGSLRIGRLLIPYLNPGNYIGVEPAQWLVNDGIQNEVGNDLVRIKKPTFSFKSSLEEFKTPLNIDYAVAQSVFSHCSKDLIKDWLHQVFSHLKNEGALFATFVPGVEDFQGRGWQYPDCVRYLPATIASLACDCGFNFRIIDWKHPRQIWAVFSKPQFDMDLIAEGDVSWNHMIDKAARQV